MRAASAVLDTNVIVSALLKAEGREALILDLAVCRRFSLAVSEPLLEEYEGVLRRPRFGFDPQEVARSLRAIRGVAAVVEPRERLNVARDPDDNMILECAVEAGSEFVVTGNTRHFPARFRRLQVLPPRQFLIVLAARLE